MNREADKIAIAEAQLGYQFQDRVKCLKALQASGHALIWQGQFLRIEKNDRLAIFGDTVVKTILAEMWYETGQPKSNWTTIEQDTLKNANLSQIGFSHGFDAAVILNDGTPEVSPKAMATTIEALLGAVYLDGGAEAMRRVLHTLGMIHPFLQVVTYISNLFRANTLVSMLIEFLDCGLMGLEISCTSSYQTSYV